MNNQQARLNAPMASIRSILQVLTARLETNTGTVPVYFRSQGAHLDQNKMKEKRTWHIGPLKTF